MIEVLNLVAEMAESFYGLRTNKQLVKYEMCLHIYIYIIYTSIMKSIPRQLPWQLPLR